MKTFLRIVILGPIAIVVVALAVVNNQPVTLVYLARAVMPGTYHVPPSQVESMYVPGWRATGTADDMLIVVP